MNLLRELDAKAGEICLTWISSLEKQKNIFDKNL